MSRIVLFGATGYTGRLTARALQKRGLSPLLVGRNPERLRALAGELGGLETAAPADATDPATLKRLLSPGDVLVSTVGPFWKHGGAQLSAALAARAHYVDSCGESAYYRHLFEREREAARAAGSAVLTACAYDFFPGNLAADSVLQLAGSSAVRVEIGYAGEVPPGYKISAGSQASGLASMLEPGLFWRGGRHVVEPVGVRLGSFESNGSRRPGISMAGTEHLFLPELYPQLRDIDSFWGWAGRATRAVHQVYRTAAAIARRPTLKSWASAALGRLARSDGSGPADALRERATSFVSAAAFDAHGRKLAVARLGDIDGFSFTANILAWTAGAIAEGALRQTGVIGPVQAFGREQLQKGHAESGFELKAQLLASPEPSVAASAFQAGGP